MPGIQLTQCTTAQMNAIVSPQQGLMVENVTTHTPWVYNGTAWAPFVNLAAGTNISLAQNSTTGQVTITNTASGGGLTTLTSTAGSITISGSGDTRNLDLPINGVSAGTYFNPFIQVNTRGIITSAGSAGPTIARTAATTLQGADAIRDACGTTISLVPPDPFTANAPLVVYSLRYGTAFSDADGVLCTWKHNGTTLRVTDVTLLTVAGTTDSPPHGPLDIGYMDSTVLSGITLYQNIQPAYIEIDVDAGLPVGGDETTALTFCAVWVAPGLF